MKRPCFPLNYSKFARDNIKSMNLIKQPSFHSTIKRQWNFFLKDVEIELGSARVVFRGICVSSAKSRPVRFWLLVCMKLMIAFYCA